MKLRTSCFNKAIFRKDMTRFAPVGALYTLCLIGGLTLMSASEDAYPFWIASRMTSCIQYMGLVNLLYGPLMAALLFGDLYNSRMCNGLHAMPLRRQELFATHIVSGLTYSLVPTAVMMLISLPMMTRTIVTNAWQISLYWWLATNLQFVCFFGFAVFAALCAGNWLGMAVVYAGLQGGTLLAYALIDAFYTPLLEGVITSDWLATLLCPLNVLLQSPIDVDPWTLLTRLFYGREAEMTAGFTLNSQWTGYFVWAAIGILFLGFAWLLYRKRDLESAGDPIAVKALVPIMQVLCSLGLGGLAGMVFQEMLSGSHNQLWLGYVVVFVAVAVAWFAVRMVLCRTSRVFQKRAFLGLLPVLAVMGLTLGATYLDIFGIEDWVPDASQVQSVQFSGYNWSKSTDPAGIEAAIRLHEIGLQEEDIPYNGRYDGDLLAQGLSLEEVYQATEDNEYDDEDYYLGNLLSAGTIYLTYDLGHGCQVSRRYLIWFDDEVIELMRTGNSNWEQYLESCKYGFIEGDPLDIEDLDQINVDGSRGFDPLSSEDRTSLLAALKADCEAGNLFNDRTAVFRTTYMDYETGEERYSYFYNIYLNLSTDAYGETRTMGISAAVYPKATNTIQWLRDHGYMNYEILTRE